LVLHIYTTTAGIWNRATTRGDFPFLTEQFKKESAQQVSADRLS